MKSFITKILLVLFGLLVAFGAAELAIRAAFRTESKWQEDPATGLLILKQIARLVSENTCLRQEIQTNSLGFNDRDHDVAKPTGTVRIAVLGDSMVEGVHVPAERRFSSMIEERLNRAAPSGTRYEVLNFGITSHGTLENILYFDSYARRFDPDLVINAVTVDNDILEDAHSTRPIPDIEPDGRPKSVETTMRERVRSLARNSRLAVLVWNRMQSIRQRAAAAPVRGSDGIPFEREVYLATSTPFWDAAWHREEDIVASLNKTIFNSGSRLLMISLAEGFRTHPDLLAALGPAYAVPGRFDFDGPERRLAEITASKDIPYLALLPAFRERARRDPDARTVFSCDGHWNETGHAWAAEVLADYLREHATLIAPH